MAYQIDLGTTPANIGRLRRIVEKEPLVADSKVA
jgi:hypothetical protein